MPRCPNCGRETQRTEDWACQWCGHPLLSGAFKRIPKTYRELQEERSLNASPAPEEEPEPAPGAEAEVEPKPPPAPVPEPTPAPPEAEAEPEAPPSPEPAAAAEAEVEVEREPAPPPEPETETIESSEPIKELEPAPVAEAETEVEPPPVPPPAPAPEPTPAPPEAEPATEPIAEAEPEAAAVPAQEPVAAPTLEPDPATGTINATVEELNAAFNSDKAGTNAKLLNKLLQVTGPVHKIFAKDNLDIFYIILAGAGRASTWQVRCTFSREHGAYLSRLTEGQEQTVQGTYAGYERNIILKECNLVQ